MSKHIEWSDLYPNTIVSTQEANLFLNELLNDVKEVIQQEYGVNPPEDNRRLELSFNNGKITFEPKI